MKTAILLLTLVAVALSNALNAQPCYNQIRTNPEDPQNIPCPDLENVFDWRANKFPSNSTSAPGGGGVFTSPYHELTNPQLLFLNLSSFHTFRDFKPEEGWELIGEYFNPDVPDDYVCFVMYNRFESYLRIFTTLPNIGRPVRGISANVEILAGSYGGYSALLSPANGISQALDKTSIPSIHTTNLYGNSNWKFNYFDVPVEYDPCTCTLEDTYLHIDFGRTIYQNLDFFVRYSDEATPVVTAIDFFGNEFPNDFVTSSGQVGETYDDGTGIHVYNTWGALMMQHHNWSKKHPFLEEKNNKIVAFGKGMELALEAEGAGPMIEPMLQYKAIELNDTTSVSGKDILNDFLRISQLWGAGVKKRVDGSGNYRNRLGTTSISYGDMNIKDRVASEFNERRSMKRALPGSSTANCDNPDLYPSYNEVLGRFAVLETPKLSQVGQVHVQRALNGLDFASLFVQFIPESFKYVFNPAAGIIADETEMWASLEFEIPTEGFWSAASTLDISGNLLEHYRDSQVVLLTTPLMPLSCLGEYVPEIIVSCISSDYQFEYPNFESMKVRLKLFVDYQFEGEQRALQLYTYPVNFNLNAEYAYSLNEQTPPIATPAYPEVLTLANTHFQEDQLVFAWSSIEITGDLTAAPGVAVEVIAPNITLADGVTADPSIQLQIGFAPSISCQTIEAYPAADLAAFCNSGAYQARFTSYSVPEEPIQEQVPGVAISLSVFPNPMEDLGTLELMLPADTRASAYLSDMHGRRIGELISPRDLPAGKHLFDISLINLPAGMYLITLLTPEDLQTMKIIHL